MPFLNIVDPTSACETLPQTLAINYTYPLDPFQQHAVAAISRDENVLVTAKTGSGKTLVGEYQIAHSLAKGRRVFYTTPIKSLSNQKFYDLKKLFPSASVGIMTGDLKFRPDADVVIMTTEILRNLLFKANTATASMGITADLSLDRLDAVIFDECHYINDKDRGAVWEETMILLPREVNLVLLSATIEAPEMFANWLGELKQKPIHLISTQYRVVPLLHAVYRGDTLIPIMDSKDHFEAALYNAWLRDGQGQAKAADEHKARVADRRRGGYEDAAIARDAKSQKSFPHQMNQLIKRLDEQTLLPALFFVFSRAGCEKLAARVEATLITSSEGASIKHIMDFHLHRFHDSLQKMPQYHALYNLLQKGIAFHHSGVLPILKEVVEILFSRGLVKLLFATETFAVGINMPTKTVVFTGYRKYDDQTGGMRILNTDEYIQMAGRAGRRGKDDKGLVLYLPDRDPESMEDVKRMMTGARATFKSRMTFHYDFLLKTIHSGNLDWLRLMKQSYWWQRHQILVKDTERDIERIQGEMDALGIKEEEVKGLEAVHEIKMTLKTSQNAAKRKAQAALDTWNNSHMGPRWHILQHALWPKRNALCIALSSVETSLEALSAPQRDVWDSLHVLERWGFLEPFDDKEDKPLTLTPLGTMATEVNEGHLILVPAAYTHGAFKELTGIEILTVLAAFLDQEKEGGSPDSLQVSPAVKSMLWSIDAVAKDMMRVEILAPPKSTFWNLQTTWVEPMWRWLNGATTAELCADYGVYEGNLTRSLLKMANILEEIRNIATLSKDIEMLEKLKGLEDLLLRDVLKSDSLYLRI